MPRIKHLTSSPETPRALRRRTHRLAQAAAVAVVGVACLSAVPSSAAPSSPSPSAAPGAGGTPQAGAGAGAGAAARRSLSKLAGVPAHWVPKRTRNGTVVIRRAGAVVEDLRVNGDLIVAAPNVTLRRVEVIGGRIDNNAERACYNGLHIVRSTVRATPGGRTSDQDLSSIGTGGYVAKRVKISGTAEGFRVGGHSAGCGPVKIIDSVARVTAPDQCDDWHGDGLQGYDGSALTIRNVKLTLVERNGCYGTAPFFYPAGQGNTSADIQGLRVEGGGYPFRLGTSGKVRGLRVARDSWGYGPYDVACDKLSAWEASVVAPGRRARAIGCRTQGGY